MVIHVYHDTREAQCSTVNNKGYKSDDKSMYTLLKTEISNVGLNSRVWQCVRAVCGDIGCVRMRI